MDDRMLSERATADFLGVTQRTLQAWRSRGGGPRFVRYSSRCIRYRLSDLNDWLTARTFAHTAEFGDGTA